MWRSFRKSIVESPNSLGAQARLRRWRIFENLFPNIKEMSVLDLGGTIDMWERSPVRPRRVTVLNICEPGESDHEWLESLEGDACRASKSLEALNVSTSFDLVFSNSVLEHLGGHAKRMEFALEVRKLAPRHWIQTPYRYFPLEPHWLFPGMQFLPVAFRVKIAEHWPLGHAKPKTSDDARSEVLWTELVGKSEMYAYFPTSTILCERALGLTKSLIAVS